MKDVDRVIDGAEVFDSDYTNSVRTEWKNKRKRSITDSTCYPLTKDVPCSVHAKICRYYSKSLSVISCKCKRVLTSSGIKRALSNDDSRENDRSGKRRSQLEIQETTPSKCGEVKTVQRMLIHDFITRKKSNAPVKITIKRKLCDMPSFIDDSQCKRMARERVLYPIKDKKINQCESELQDVGVISEFKTSHLGNMVDSELSKCQATEEDECVDELYDRSDFSLLTTNLPNYVKDGTSPYIHRCPRIQKENLDWLTKFRNSNVKKAEIDKSEKIESSPKSNSRMESKVQLLSAKRKQTRSSSVEGKTPTLHKYFKISSKPPDISYMSQEVQKKTY